METRCSMAQARGMVQVSGMAQVRDEGANEVWPVWADVCTQARCGNDRRRRVMGVMSRKSRQATQGGEGKAGSWCGHLRCVTHE